MLGKIPAARLALIEKIAAHARRSLPAARRALAGEEQGLSPRGRKTERLLRRVYGHPAPSSLAQARK